ncbi:hypothetical protein GKC30_01385 [Pseudodesulfovibrio sp. F-1]|uniref:Uncharacterized protein n=1 Tax=Pseudodesulfovibrio alkaliphilus TaxID=2661613 RepID=A0A7K1KJV3_9BACT|nr:hypothetical protein [Pseudodesulfovibrio alkaliphilus]MUM76281.1 hypothetical protein [Pseudodesulfovibrio alkaliphilus]
MRKHVWGIIIVAAAALVGLFSLYKLYSAYQAYKYISFYKMDEFFMDPVKEAFVIYSVLFVTAFIAARKGTKLIDKESLQNIVKE